MKKRIYDKQQRLIHSNNQNKEHHSHCGCAHEHHCDCSHGHIHARNLTNRLIFGAILFFAGITAEHFIRLPQAYDKIISVILYIAAYMVLGYDVIITAVKNIAKGHIFDENLLMSIASIGAFVIGEQPEAAAVMLFYQLGESLQDKAVDNSRREITKLMDLRPDYANLEENGEIKRVSPKTISPGQIIVLNHGERLALDGEIISGAAYLDTSALTGESAPRAVSAGDAVLSGSINTSSTIRIRVTKEFKESTVSKILEMAEHAQDKKASSEKFITVFAKYYTPIVVILAALIVVVPSAITGEWIKWIYRGLTMLVVSCPCALVVSIPLGFFAGLGAASKNQVLIKGGNYLEMLSKLGTVVFDKTGTLTNGGFKVTGVSSDDTLKTAAYAEFYSNHPIAASVKAAYGKKIEYERISGYTEIPGRGISAKLDDTPILAGNAALMSEYGIKIPNISDMGTILYIAKDNTFLGHLAISDTIKADAKKAVSQLNKLNINSVMLTGDKKAPSERAAAELGIDEVYSELLPQDKVICLEEIMNSANGYTAFAGDGINDAPSLARADIGIAMGAIGSDSAIEAADIVIMNDEPSKICDAIKVSKHTLRIIKENIVFSISVKVIIMLLSVLGIANMWLAIFGDVGVALAAILNSTRAFYQSHKKTL